MDAETVGRGGRVRSVLRRWPTAVALALFVPDVVDGVPTDPGAAATFGEALPLLPLAYLVLAKWGRRWLTWPVVFAGVACVAALRAFDLMAPSTFLVGVALAVLVWSVVDGDLKRSGELRLQAVGVLVFGAFALAGLAIDVDLGRYVVAAGWLFHGVWDFVHLWRDKVVARSFAEWCGVVDVLVAVQLVFLI
ncbi:hypothetical protein [Glycomyces paridis]|nr:hypothetical protein [Glycomyces paridis]